MSGGGRNTPYTPSAVAVNDPFAPDEPPVRRPARRPMTPISLLDALRRNLLLVFLPIVVLVSAALLASLIRTPTYTSEARLNVGGVALTTESIPGYTVAVQFLAISYARAVDATAVVAPVAARLHISPQAVASQVSATPIQNSPVVAIDATSKDPGQAVRLANAMSGALVRYAVHLNSGQSPSRQLLVRYLADSRTLQAANAQVQNAPPHSAVQRSAQTRADVARLQLQTTGTLYQQSQAGQSTQNLVQQLTPASPATSDRSSVLQQYAAGGLLAGLLIGVGLAVERANRVSLRRVRHLASR